MSSLEHAATSAGGRPFGSTGGLLHRLRPARIDASDLRDAADRLFPELATAQLRVAVVDRPSGGAVVVVEEAERSTRVALVDLAEEMAHAGVRGTPEGMAAALTAWVARRPVTDAAAAERAVAVLDWSDAEHSALGWRPMVRRGGLALPWQPSAAVDAAALAATRRAATGRSAQLPLDLRVEGPIALWSHPVTALATAVLASPARLLTAVAAAGLAVPDLHVVVTPYRPVACAAPGVAARLAGQAAEDRLVLHWEDLADLPWL